MFFLLPQKYKFLGFCRCRLHFQHSILYISAMKKGGLFFLLLWHLVVQGQYLFPIQAHRGARAYYPENSLYAFAQCVKEGGRILELDVVISRDGQIVVSHEPWLN